MAKKKIIIIYLKNGGNTQRSSCLWIVLSPGALLEVAPTVHVCTVGAAPPCRGQATLHLALPSQQHLNKRHSWAKPSLMQVQNNVPACGSLRAYACTHSSCLVCVKERKEKQGRAVFVKQTVDSVCVSFLIHLCLHP